MGGAEGWFLTLGSRRLELSSGEHVVGRSRDCDIVVRDPTVSRAHALVAVEGSRVTVQDLGSSNGVAVNGLRIHVESELSAGDQVSLGRVRMTLSRGVTPDPTTVTTCPDCDAPVRPGDDACPRCGRWLGARRPLSRSEAVGMSEVMAVGEALASPPRSLDETLPPYPAAWREPADEVAIDGGDQVPETATSAVSLDTPPPEAFDDAASPIAVARAAAEDSPPPRVVGTAEDDAAEEVEGAGDRDSLGDRRVEAGWFLPAAGFWARAAAFVVDLTAPLGVALLAAMAAGGWRAPAGLAAATAAGLVAWMAVSLPFWTRRGDSPGKRLLALRVCDLDGRPGITGSQAVIRFAGYLLGVLTLGLGFAVAGLTASRRGLHDRLAGTYVGRVQRSRRLL